MQENTVLVFRNNRILFREIFFFFVMRALGAFIGWDPFFFFWLSIYWNLANFAKLSFSLSSLEKPQLGDKFFNLLFLFSFGITMVFAIVAHANFDFFLFFLWFDTWCCHWPTDSEIEHCWLWFYWLGVGHDYPLIRKKKDWRTFQAFWVCLGTVNLWFVVVVQQGRGRTAERVNGSSSRLAVPRQNASTGT